MSWTINQARGRAEVPAEDRRAVALCDALPSVRATTGNLAVGVPFLTLSDELQEQGPMAFWDLRAAWFYRKLAPLSESRSGYQDYANTTKAASLSRHIRVPLGSFYVEAGYLPTDETRSRVGVVKSNRPFSLRKGEFGPGASEIFGRYGYMDIGPSV